MPHEWDETKRAINRRKHGRDFADIVMFDWERALVVPDDREDYGEARDIAIGFIGDKLCHLVYSERGDDVIRIISLRNATRKERETYVKNSRWLERGQKES